MWLCHKIYDMIDVNFFPYFDFWSGMEELTQIYLPTWN